MKLSLFVTAFLAVGLQAIAAELPVGALDYYALSARWAKRSVADIEADSTRGDAVAQFYLGQLLIAGRGVAREVERGLTLLRQSAAQGNAEAMAELGRRQLYGEGVPEDLDEALRLARAAASRSNGAGLHLLGELQASGIGMAADARAALQLYEQAVAAGSPVAMRTIGRAHLLGRYGFKPDPAEANRWYLRSAEAGYPPAMNAYGYSLLAGRGIAVDEAAGAKWMLRAVAAGFTEGMQELAKAQVGPGLLLQGWRDAAKVGDAAAQFHLARLIATGEAEPSGPDETPHRLLLAAAEGEHIQAALMLGDRYRWGYGGPRDLVAASRWFLHGASFVGDLGDSTAKMKIGSASLDPAMPGGLNNWFREGDWKARRKGDDAVLATVMDLYLRAATRRDTPAMRELAALYQRGSNVPTDPVEAVAWLLLAGQAGSTAAATEADTVLKNLTAEQQQRARERTRHLVKRTL